MEFNDDIKAQHEQIDSSEWDYVYVVGDVHGCREELDRLLSELNPNSGDLLIFVGDLITKGPDSGGVVDLVRSSPNMLSVRGNNEEKLLIGISGATYSFASDVPRSCQNQRARCSARLGQWPLVTHESVER
jgi:hypothetical protein